MIQQAAILVLFSIIGGSYGMNCTGISDGNYEIACRSYAVCTSGVVSIVDCPIGEVYSKTTSGCDDAANVPAPCGKIMDCSGKVDQKYPDANGDCHSFYTCTGHDFKGHQICPGATVFNEKLQSCDWDWDVDPPCGTKGVA